MADQLIAHNGVGVAGSLQLGAPVNNGLTGLAVGSVLVAVDGAGCFLIQDGQFAVMVVPGINNVVQLGSNADVAAECAKGAVSVLSLTVNDLAINGNHRAVAGFIPGLRCNGVAGHRVNTGPGPQTDGDADQNIGSGSHSGLSDEGDGQLVGVAVDGAVSHHEAGGNDQILRLPVVGILQPQSCSQTVQVSHVSNLQIHIVNGIVLGCQAAVVVTGQSDGSITGNGEGAGHSCQVAQLVADLEGNGVRTAGQSHLCGGHDLAGNGGVQSNTVHQNLSGGSIQGLVVGNLGGESNRIAINFPAIGQLDGSILGSVADTGNGGQHTVLHSGGVVQGNVVDVEGVNSGGIGLDISSDERGGTRIAGIGSNGSAQIVVRGEVDGGIDPTGFGDICLSSGVQVLYYTANSGKGEVGLLAGVGAVRILCIELGLECQTCCALGDIQPHAQSGSILAVGNVTQDDGLANIEQHIVGPACKCGVRVVSTPCQRIVAVLDLAAVFNAGHGDLAGDLLAELTSQRIGANQGVVHAVVNGPLLGILEAHEACGVAIFKVIDDLGALAVGNGQHIGHGCIGQVSNRHIHTGNGLILGGGQGETIQSCGIFVGQCQGVCAIQANIPAVCTVDTNNFNLHGLAIGQDSLISGKAKLIGSNNIQSHLANDCAVVDSLDGSNTGLGTGGVNTVDNGTHVCLGNLIGHISRNIHGELLGILTDDGDGRRSAGCDVLILGVKHDLIEHTGSTSSGNQDHGVDGGTLCAIGGDGTHNVSIIGGTLGNEGGRTAAVTVNSVDTAQSQHHFAHLIVGQTTGNLVALTAVNMAEDQGAVGLDTDHGTGSVRGSTLDGLVGIQLAVFNQPVEVCGDSGLLATIQRGGHGAQLTVALLVNGQVGLCALVDLGSTQNHTVPDHVAIRSVGVICQSGVHCAHNIITHILIVLDSLGQLHSLPILGLVDNALQRQVVRIQLVNSVITGHDLNVFVLGINSENMDQLTVTTSSIVQSKAILLCAGSQVIYLFFNNLEVLAGNRGIIQLGPCFLLHGCRSCAFRLCFSGKCSCGEIADHHNCNQKHGQKTRELRIVHTKSSFPNYFLFNISFRSLQTSKSRNDSK